MRDREPSTRAVSRETDRRDVTAVAPDVMAKLDPWITTNVTIRSIVEERWSSRDWSHVKNILRDLLAMRVELEHGRWWN